VADVDPVADDRGRPDLDVEVAVDRAVVADHRLLADPQHALVRTQLDPFAEVRPAADDQLAVAAADLEPDAGPDEGVPLELDLGVPQPDPQVAQRGPQVSGGEESPGGQPAQRPQRAPHPGSAAGFTPVTETL